MAHVTFDIANLKNTANLKGMGLCESELGCPTLRPTLREQRDGFHCYRERLFFTELRVQ